MGPSQTKGEEVTPGTARHGEQVCHGVMYGDARGAAGSIVRRRGIYGFGSCQAQ